MFCKPLTRTLLPLHLGLALCAGAAITPAAMAKPVPTDWAEVESYRKVPIAFANGSDKLKGSLILPAGKGPFPVVVFVAGSGPSQRDGYGVLPPIWERLAREGFASFAWDKPGTGESAGNWQGQLPAERVRETVAAVAAAAGNRLIDPKRIGLWGISQAGWNMPQAVVDSGKVAFVISVSGPVGTGRDQDNYRVEQSMRADSAAEKDIADALAFNRQRGELMARSAPYAEVKALQDRLAVGKSWADLVGVYNEDAYKRLRGPQETPMAALRQVKVPVLAIFGERDRIVDWKQSIAGYRDAAKEAKNPDLTIITFPGADHVIFSSVTGGDMELNHNFSLPHKTFAPGYLDTMVDWLRPRFGKNRR